MMPMTDDETIRGTGVQGRKINKKLLIIKHGESENGEKGPLKRNTSGTRSFVDKKGIAEGFLSPCGIKSQKLPGSLPANVWDTGRKISLTNKMNVSKSPKHSVTGRTRTPHTGSKRTLNEGLHKKCGKKTIKKHNKNTSSIRTLSRIVKKPVTAKDKEPISSQKVGRLINQSKKPSTKLIPTSNQSNAYLKKEERISLLSSGINWKAQKTERKKSCEKERTRKRKASNKRGSVVGGKEHKNVFSETLSHKNLSARLGFLQSPTNRGGEGKELAESKISDMTDLKTTTRFVQSQLETKRVKDEHGSSVDKIYKLGEPKEYNPKESTSRELKRAAFKSNLQKTNRKDGHSSTLTGLNLNVGEDKQSQYGGNEKTDKKKLMRTLKSRYSNKNKVTPGACSRSVDINCPLNSGPIKKKQSRIFRPLDSSKGNTYNLTGFLTKASQIDSVSGNIWIDDSKKHMESSKRLKNIGLGRGPVAKLIKPRKGLKKKHVAGQATISLSKKSNPNVVNGQGHSGSQQTTIITQEMGSGTGNISKSQKQSQTHLRRVDMLNIEIHSSDSSFEETEHDDSAAAVIQIQWRRYLHKKKSPKSRPKKRVQQPPSAQSLEPSIPLVSIPQPASSPLTHPPGSAKVKSRASSLQTPQERSEPKRDSQEELAEKPPPPVPPVSEKKPPDSSQQVYPSIVNKYHNFAEQQRDRWKEVNNLIERLNNNQTIDPKEIVKEMMKLKKATEVNLCQAESNLKDLENLQEPVKPMKPLLSRLKRQPVRPTSQDQPTLPNLRLEIERIRADSMRQDELLALGSQRSNAADDSGTGARSQQTPTSQSNLRISTEKWMVPGASKKREEKVALAKAFIKETEEKSRAGADFKMNSLRNSAVSLSSVGNELFLSNTGSSPRNISKTSRSGQQPPKRVLQLEIEKEDDKECQVIIDDIYSVEKAPSGNAPEEQAVIELNSYHCPGDESQRAMLNGEVLKSQSSFLDDKQDSFKDLNSPKLSKTDLELGIIDPPSQDRDENKRKESQDSKSEVEATPVPKELIGNEPIPHMEPIEALGSTDWAEMLNSPPLSPSDDIFNRVTLNNGAITIENTDTIQEPIVPNPVKPSSALSQPSEPNQQAVQSPSSSSDPLEQKQTKDLQTDILTAEVLNLLFDELMMDGLVLRELFKLQIELPNGIKTNIKAVKKYLTKLCEFIGTNFLKSVHQRLNCPLGPTPQERLRLFHSEVDDENEDSSYAKISYEQVLDIDIYFDLEEYLMDAENIDLKEQPDVSQLEMEHIHNKMLFDCLNESLDACRVFGLKGQPLALRTRGRSSAEISQEQVMTLLTQSAQRVVEWSTFMCGFIPFKDDSFIQVPRAIDEETLNQIKEDRLVRLLTDEVYESDEKWNKHEDEEIEVEVELSDMLFEHLIIDVVESLVGIRKKKYNLDSVMPKKADNKLGQPTKKALLPAIEEEAHIIPREPSQPRLSRNSF